MNKIFTMILAAAAIAATTSGYAQTKWDLPTGFLPSSYITENVQQFANDVDKATAGKLKITLHTNGSLYKHNEIKRALQTGQVQIAEFCLCIAGNENALFALDQVPYLVTSYAGAHKLHLAAKAATEKLLASQGMKMLFAVPWPPQGLFTMKPIASAADFRGTKMRAAHPAGARLAQLLQAQPITINLPELPQALSTGMVDVFQTAAVAALETKLYEQAKYFYDVKAWLPKNAVVVNQKAFAALDTASQNAVLKAAAAAEARGWATSEKKDSEALKEIVAKGMKVEIPSATLMKELHVIGTTLTAEWSKTAGADGKAIIDAFNKM